MRHRAAQVAGFGGGVVVEKVNEIAVGGLERGIALGRGLFAARHDDLQLVGRVIQGAAGSNGFDLGLAGPGRDQHRNARHVLVHARRLKSGAATSKRKSQIGFDKFRQSLTFPSAPDGVVAQLVERLNGIQEVRGSNPLGSTIHKHR